MQRKPEHHMSIVFAAISPHAPLFLPSVGPQKDRDKVKETIKSLEELGKRFKESKPDSIIISSPHPDWGFNVPLHFIAKDFKGKTEAVLTGTEKPKQYFEKGKSFPLKQERVALIASGDMSHCLKEDGPYGFHPDGPKFDRAFQEALKKKDLKTILSLEEKYPEAAECGLRSFCFMLGILDNEKWQPQILSYQDTFGVGYLTVSLKL
jgi:aromatic ring-opening dioxygenase LigB subunit